MIRAVAVLAAVVLSAGCTGAPQPGPSVSGIRFDLDMSPRRPAALRTTTLRLRALDAAGRPVALQGFRATAEMPEMRHRGETIAFREVEPGLYEALHTFSMDGRWEVHITGSVRGRRAEVRIPVDVGGGR